MNIREQQLRAELQAESELITPGSLRPLDFRQADDLASAHPLANGRGRRLRLAWLAPVAAAASVTVIVALTGIVSGHGPRAGRPLAGAGVPTSGAVQGVTALSARDAWAVGYLDLGRTNGPNDTNVPLMLHWNGARWQRVKVPALPGGQTELYSIAGTSPSNLWAVGYGGAGDLRPVIMHWNGSNWRLQRFAAAAKAGGLSDVTVVSATDAWAVGNLDGRVPGPLILHWDGKNWSQSPTPASASGSSLDSVTAISARDVWAVGNFHQGQILHWNGSSWTQVPIPHLHKAPILSSVSAGPDGAVWVAGYTEHPLAALLFRWTGRGWRQAVVRHRGLGNEPLAAITVLSRRDIWAAGTPFGGPDTVILHWNGATWARLTTPGTTFRGGISDLAATSASDVWAAGYRGVTWDGVPQILHWNGSRWTRSYGPTSTKGLQVNDSCGPYATCANPTPSQ